MSLNIQPTFSPSYAIDTEATAKIRIHKSGYCPIHPDIKIRQRQIWTKSYFPCSRCEEIHDVNMHWLKEIEEISNRKGVCSTEDFISLNRERELILDGNRTRIKKQTTNNDLGA